jgi:ribosomal protein S13
MYAYLSPHKKKHTLIEEEINTLNDLYEEYYSSNQTSKNFITDVNEEYSEEDYYGVKHIKIL